LIIIVVVMLIGYGWNWVTLGEADPYAVDDYPIIEAFPPIFMMLSVLALGIAWRWENWGAAIVLGFQLVTVVLLLIQRFYVDETFRSAIPFMLSLVIVIPGLLFLAAWLRSRNRYGIGEG
jgi:hypothetical protein